MKNNLLTLLILSYIVVRLVFVGITANWQLPDYNILEEKYRSSQYCLTGLREQFDLDNLSQSIPTECGDGETFGGNINDPELYIYAGYRYVKGVDPAGINFELQPLGKYLLGIPSILGLSPLIIQWISLFVICILIYKFARNLGMSAAFSLLPIAVLVSDSLIHEQLMSNYLDLTQTAFTMLSVYLLFDALQKKSSFIYLAVGLGLVALSKSFSIGVLSGMVALAIIFFHERKRTIEYLSSLTVSIVVYLLGYTMFFVDNGIASTDFFRLHLTILKLYKNYVPEYPLGEIWRIIVLGEWRTWWGDKGIIKVPEWTIFWPLGVISSIVILLRSIYKKMPLLMIISLWVLIYLVFVSMRLVFPRYLLPILPLIYLVFVYSTHYLLQITHKKLS